MGKDWHIMMVFEVPRGADLTMEVIEQLGNSRPEISAVSILPNGRLEFLWRDDNRLCLAAFTVAYQRLSDACADVLGHPADLLHAEVAQFEYWVDQIDADGEIQRWIEKGIDGTG